MASKGKDTKSGPIDVLCMATKDENCDFKPMRLQRRAVGDYDILMAMQYCGICHTDLHISAGHTAALTGKHYPCVPGHELSGIVIDVGPKVTKFKVGDHAGVGCMVDSCLKCSACLRGEEQKCTSQIATYGGKDKSGRAATYPVGIHTYGGYTDKFVVNERFGIVIPKSYDLKYAGPVMCSGVTLYSPMKKYNAKAGSRIAVVGIGCLGQMGIKIGKALGCTVTAITRSPAKVEFAKKCGADAVLISTDAAQMKKAAKSFDLVLNTIPSEHDYSIYTNLVANRGKQVMLGLNSGLVAGMVVDGITCGSSKVTGSGIGSILETQEVIDLCAKHQIYPEIKVISVTEINYAYEQLDRCNESGERFVLDLANTLNDSAFEKCTAPPPKFGTPTPPLGLGTIVGAICGLFCSCKWC